MNVHLFSDRKKKQLIAIAASQAGFDTSDKDSASNYRVDILARLTGKTSTTKMSPSELTVVLHHFVDRGFTLTAKKSAKGNPPWLRKLLSDWQTMYEQGFIEDPSFKSLETWAKRQIRSKCASRGIEIPGKLDWMGRFSNELIEQLKKYHLRCLAEAIPQKWEQFMDIYEENPDSFPLREVANIERIWVHVLDANIGYQDALATFQSITVLLNRYSKEAS